MILVADDVDDKGHVEWLNMEVSTACLSLERHQYNVNSYVEVVEAVSAVESCHNLTVAHIQESWPRCAK